MKWAAATAANDTNNTTELTDVAVLRNLTLTFMPYRIRLDAGNNCSLERDTASLFV